MELLKIGIGNAKLGLKTAIVDLPAGHTCPFAKDCAEKVDPITGKLIVNPDAKFRCFAAVSELISPAARVKRWGNLDLIKGLKNEQDIADLLVASLTANKKLKDTAFVRIHSSGDFFNQMYFNAWMLVAKAMPEKIFYAYTKSLKFWVTNLGNIPTNLHITASRGGKNDELIELFDLKNVEVVYSEQEAIDKNLEIDHDDSCVYNPEIQKFALLIHGMQAKGSDASKAVSALKKKGITGYQKGKSRI